jgi:hypothetical protein
MLSFLVFIRVFKIIIISQNKNISFETRPHYSQYSYNDNCMYEKDTCTLAQNKDAKYAVYWPEGGAAS